MQNCFHTYTEILKEELVKAMGCTEPVSIAYASSVAAEILGERVKKAECLVCANIVKNVKSAAVPNTGGLRGIEAAVAAGAAVGKAEEKLQVLAGVSLNGIDKIKEFLNTVPVKIIPVDNGRVFDIGIKLYGTAHSSFVRIVDFHTNIITVQRDGRDIGSKYLCREKMSSRRLDHEKLSVKNILDFADGVDLRDVKPVLDMQLECNMAIARCGITGNYGSNIGSVFLSTYGDSAENKAKAYAAAASDARMNGCPLPVVINSGSGNQGITASVPVAVYSREKGFCDEKLYRALLVSNLCTVHIKDGIGTLSAYCGVVAAGAGAGAGIAYLEDGSFEAVSKTLSNALAITSGIICDGAKASCAAKILTAVSVGFFGFHMYETHNSFRSGDGIVKTDIEQTIVGVGCLASRGMRETDRETVRIMLNG